MSIQPSQEQEKIIKFDNNAIVVSNPGTGKTTTLSWKVMRLLETGVNPENILCITFTEKAKKEMFEKIFEMAKGKFPDSEIMKLNIHTFHGFAFNYLVDAGLITREITGNNAMRYAILESYENNKAFNYTKDYLISEIVPKSENALRYIKSFGITHDKINVKKTSDIIEKTYDETKSTYTLDEMLAFLKYFVSAYKDYEESKLGAVDYSDMLLIFIEKFRGKKFQYVLVDEMQDMNELEAKIVEMVGENIFLVGDAKQAIFGFQGGSVKNFERFMKTCQPMLLSTNRRSTQQILDYSKTNFLQRTSNKKDFAEQLETFNSIKEAGEHPKIISTRAHLTQIQKIIEENKEKTVAIITRTNSQIVEISQFLDSCNIQYSSTTSQATTEMAKGEIISYLRGMISDRVEYKISATFTIFSPFTLKEAFEISESHKRKRSSDNLEKIKSFGISLKREDIDKTFDDIIYPLCVSKGAEWFSTAITIKQQVDEYLSLPTPTIDGLFDFIAIAEESYTERNIDSKITLTTVHKAKGRDFDVVVYLPKSSASRTSFIDVIVQAILESSGIDIKKELVEESLRIDFVAFTRAKEKLIIITDDKDKAKYYVENLSEIEIDSNAENAIATKIDSRLSEAFSLFIAGRFDDSKKLLKQEDGWLEQFIINYFKSITHLSYSSVTTKPYEFLLRNIIKMPFVSNAAEFGSTVHNAMQSILENQTKLEDYKDDVRKAVENGLNAIDDLKKQYPGLHYVSSEETCDMPLRSMIEYDDDRLIFTGRIDAIFQHDDGYLIVDYKTDRNSDKASEHKRQLSVYRKMYSKLKNIPEEKIKIIIIFLALRGSVNTGKFDRLVEKEKRNAFPTFEEHLRKVLEWKQDPSKFVQDLFDDSHDDLLYQAIKGKLLHST
ncbi:UvrD-helicase domain-containing protein [Candidatus Nitrosotalea okcheonensis]|uniref:DNA 3'-5' helicase n=1 Tax=Candidatus Nitrosotalea okcheonensis TaxID=1903276 RepID=A0A2H1FIL2_9ARCH|nr:ATP-dependent DNA helicase [Candidatus Nitrosotalea okcheonensis]SMH72605.1 putative ATP-dependent DNA helicase [Candidatus Nitrosotalea okcheonensis]